VRHQLGWKPSWTLDIALEKIVSWQKNFLLKGNIRDITQLQISEFLMDQKESRYE
jgi:hypothetical protein